MNQITVEQKLTALGELYVRIERIAAEMKGTASRSNVERSFLGATVASSKEENSLALFVRMPGGFFIEFAPFYPLGQPGNNLIVQARRYQKGTRRNDWQFRFSEGEWQRTQSALSDQEIRECLTPDGPSGAFG